MSQPVRLWIAASHHPAHRCGGWAFVRVAAGQSSGAAGGERYVTAARIALAGLVAALHDLPPGPEVEIVTASPELLAFAAVLDGDPAAEAPQDDLDLWARILTAGKGRRLALRRGDAPANSPLAFCAAWAELARDKAKAAGAFDSAIPRNALAKLVLT